VIGVVCHEHRGGIREWTEREAGFASAVADLLTILIHQAERSELRAALDAQREAAAQHQKMQALVRMARVVVHDLANVMMVASARAGEIAEESNPHEVSQDVVQVLEYGGKLLNQLRLFCDQGGPDARGQVEAVGLLRGMEASLRSLLGKGLTLRLECDVPELSVAIGPIELEQLVLNLCMNARDATSQGANGEVKVALSRERDGALLEVADNGCGMDEATQTEIFEPFYTTKPGHSGVGLAAVYGSVERAHGRIALTSAPGRGTTFRITLPLSSSPQPAEPPGAF
jgi:signal transduction histidine kinase